MAEHNLKNFVKDGYQNLFAKLGIGVNELQSSSTYTSNQGEVTLDRNKLDNIYETSWVAGRGIDVLADDMTKKGIDIKSELTPDEVMNVQETIEDLGIWESLNEAIRWGNLYGGAIAVIIIDGEDLAQPLDPETISDGNFKGLKVYDRWCCVPSIQKITKMSPSQGLPEFYDVYPLELTTGQMVNNTASMLRIHHTRCMRFLGIQLPYWRAIQNLNWGASVIARWYDRLTAYDSATLGASSLLYKSYLRIMKIKGYRDILSAGGVMEENLFKSMVYVSAMENSQGYTLVDSEDSVEAINWSFSGMSEALLSFGEQIAGALEIPLVRLLGQTPHGLSSTSEQDLANYYDSVSAKQRRILKKPINKIIDITLRSMNLDTDSKTTFTFVPLWDLKEQAKLDMASSLTQTVISAESAGLITKSIGAKELKEMSRSTGIFTNITDEFINDLEELDEVPTIEGMEDETRQTQTDRSHEDGEGKGQLREEAKEGSSPVQKVDKKQDEPGRDSD